MLQLGLSLELQQLLYFVQKNLKIVSWIKHMQWSKAFSLVAIVYILEPLRIWTQSISKNNHSELHKRRKSYMDSTLIKLERPLSSTTIVWMHSWAYKNFKPWVTTTITLNCTREENHCIMGLNICCKERFLQLPFVCSLDMLKFEINQMSNNNTLTMTLHKRRIFWAAFLSCLNLDSTHEKQKQSVWIAQEKKTVAWSETLTIKSCFLHLPLSAIVSIFYLHTWRKFCTHFWADWIQT